MHSFHVMSTLTRRLRQCTIRVIVSAQKQIIQRLSVLYGPILFVVDVPYANNYFFAHFKPSFDIFQLNKLSICLFATMLCKKRQQQQQQQQKTFISKAQITTLLNMSRERKKTFKHGIMTTITEKCQLIFYYHKKLEKVEIERGENIERERAIYLFLSLFSSLLLLFSSFFFFSLFLLLLIFFH